MKKLLTLITLALSLTTLEAKTNSETIFVRGIFDSGNRNSLSVSMGAFPTIPNYIQSQRDYYDYNSTPPLIYANYKDYENYLAKRVTSPLFDLSYSYRVTKLISVGCHLSYCTEGGEYRGIYDGIYSLTARDHVFLLTPTARLHWLNRKKLELYSSIGLGYGCSYTTNERGKEGDNNFRNGISSQFTPLGMAAKFGNTYIFGEVGVGTLGALRFGVGQKF